MHQRLPLKSCSTVDLLWWSCTLSATVRLGSGELQSSLLSLVNRRRHSRQVMSSAGGSAHRGPCTGFNRAERDAAKWCDGVIGGIAYGQRPATGFPQGDELPSRAFDDFPHQPAHIMGAGVGPNGRVSRPSAAHRRSPTICVPTGLGAKHCRATGAYGPCSGLRARSPDILSRPLRHSAAGYRRGHG